MNALSDPSANSVSTRPNAWLLMVAGTDVARGTIDSYEEVPSEGYVWNSRVPNHAAIKEGDLVALWDKNNLLGISIVEDIISGAGKTTHRRCPNPNCGKSDFKKRITKKPLYRCFKCHYEFDVPIETEIDVIDYRSSHRSFWVDLENALSGSALRDCCKNVKSQHSIRALNWEKFEDVLGEKASPLSAVELELISRSSKTEVQGGHRISTVRTRIGQSSFRQKLLEKYDSTCAISGPNHPASLDAAHLYSFASISEHKEHGGILLRKDLHSLFDRKLISIDPSVQITLVSPELLEYPNFAVFDQKKLQIQISKSQIVWIKAHYKAFQIELSRSKGSEIAFYGVGKENKS